MAVAFPVIGHWYRRSNGNLFEVVAVDEDKCGAGGSCIGG